MRFWISSLLSLVAASAASAEVRKEVVEYKHGDTVLEGYMAYDDAVPGKKPGILVVNGPSNSPNLGMWPSRWTCTAKASRRRTPPMRRRSPRCSRKTAP